MEKKSQKKKKSCVVKNHNGNHLVSFIMPLHNALGIENWPQYAQDECRRVAENDSGRKFIPLEDCMLAGLDGKPLFNPWDLLGSKDIIGQRNQAIYSALNNESGSGDEVAHEKLVDDDDYQLEGDDQELEELTIECNNKEIHEEGEKVFLPRVKHNEVHVSFQGGTRQSIIKKTKHRRDKANTKRRFCDYIRRITIRTAHFNQAVLEAERLRFHQAVSEAEERSQLFVEA